MAGLENLMGKLGIGNVQREYSATDYNDADLKQCCEDILNNKASKNSKLAFLRNKLSMCVDENLKPKGMIAPGTFQTGFKQVTVLEGIDAIRPTGAVNMESEEVKKAIIASNLERLNNPGKVVPYDAITLENAINGTPPFDGTIDQNIPMTGADGHGNQVVLFQALHPGVIQIMPLLAKTHDDSKELKNDDFSWGRAAWLAFMHSTDPGHILEKLQSINCTEEHAMRIANAAQLLQIGGLDAVDFNKLVPPDRQQPGGFTLEDAGGAQPDGPPPLEYLLRKLTDQILTQSTTPENLPIGKPEDNGGRAHLRTLMARLGCASPIIGKEVTEGGKTGRNFYVSIPDAIKKATKMREDDPIAQLEFIARYSQGRALIVREGDSFKIRMPKRQVEAEKSPPVAGPESAKKEAERPDPDDGVYDNESLDGGSGSLHRPASEDGSTDAP